MNLDFANSTTKVFSEEMLRKLSECDSVIIFGAGLSGQYVFKQLIKNGIDVSCFVDSSKSKQGGELFGKIIVSLEEALEIYPEAYIVIASMWYEEIRNQIRSTSEELYKRTYNGLSTMNWETINLSSSSNEEEYIKTNLRQFEELYEMLEDTKSKETLEGILNYRLTRNLDYLEQIKDAGKEYTDERVVNESIVQTVSGRSIIDAGAFNGDTLTAFLNTFKDCRSVYCYEADRENCNVLISIKETIDAPDVFVIQKALWKESGLNLSFEGSDLSGQVGQRYSAQEPDGKGQKVETITVDDTCIENLGFVKMDIEGAEREALVGGHTTLSRDKPVLAICAYHLQDDLLVLPRQIRSIYGGYKLYLRHYMLSAGDTVLYAIP